MGFCLERAQAEALAEHGVYDDNRQDVARLARPVLVEVFGEAHAAEIIAGGGYDLLVYVQRESA